MRKRKKLVLIFLTLLCLLNNYSMYVQAADSPVDLIERVERYTSNYDKDEINLYLEKGEYQVAKKLIEEARDGYQERWDYIGLTTNDMYIAYQFKEYMTGEFLSKGWWAKVTSWFSGLFYNDELKEYLAMESPGVNKYKDMLKRFISESKDELVVLEYAKKMTSTLESVEGLYQFVDVDTYDILYNMFLEAGNKEDIDRAILNFTNDNYLFFKNDSMTYLFKCDLSEAFTIFGSGMDYIDTTVSTMMDIQYVCANMDVLNYYDDFLKNIQQAKYNNGNYIAPEDLRVAAAELHQELEGNVFNIIADAISEYGVTTATTSIELLDLIGEGLLGEILLGMDIGSVVGNAIFDMESLVKGISYVQGYAYVGEIYSIILDEDKDSFLREKTEKSAQQFRKDYEILWHIRLKGEEAYIDMCDFSETWNKDDQKILRFWTDYESKKQFVDNNMELIEKFEFKNPNFMKKYQDINIDKYLNIFLSTIYQNGIREYDFENYDIGSLMEFAYNIPVEGIPYDDGEGHYYYKASYDNVNDILNSYFGITPPKEQIGDIIFKDGEYHFPVLDYGELGMPIVIANNVESEDNKYKVMFDLAYIWPENFDTGELNPIEDWNIYYDYGIDQIKADSFCEMLGNGYAVLERNGKDLIVTEFHSGVETVVGSEKAVPLTEEEAYMILEEYWTSLGNEMPDVDYEGLTEYGYCYRGFDVPDNGGLGVTYFRICVDVNTGQLYDDENDMYLQ